MLRQIVVNDPDAILLTGVLLAEEVHALDRAAMIVQNAEADVAARLEEHEAKLQATVDEAIERGYKDGYAQFFEATEAYRKASEALQENLLDLLRDSMEVVFRERPDIDVLKAIIAPVLQSIHASDRMTIVVNPADCANLEIILAENAGEIFDGGADICPDPSLKQGSCRIYTETEAVDVSVEVTIDRLIGAISKHLDASNASDADE